MQFIRLTSTNQGRALLVQVVYHVQWGIIVRMARDGINVLPVILPTIPQAHWVPTSCLVKAVRNVRFVLQERRLREATAVYSVLRGNTELQEVKQAVNHVQTDIIPQRQVRRNAYNVGRENRQVQTARVVNLVLPVKLSKEASVNFVRTAPTRRMENAWSVEKAWHQTPIGRLARHARPVRSIMLVTKDALTALRLIIRAQGWNAAKNVSDLVKPDSRVKLHARYAVKTKYTMIFSKDALIVDPIIFRTKVERFAWKFVPTATWLTYLLITAERKRHKLAGHTVCLGKIRRMRE